MRTARRPPCAAVRSRSPRLRRPLAGCGGGTKLLTSTPAATGHRRIPSKTPQAAQKLGFPAVATKNTTRVGGADPVADAAGVALAVYPSAAPGHAPGGGHDRADRRLAGGDRRLGADGAADPGADAALRQPARCRRPPPTRSTRWPRPGSGAVGGAQVIRIGDVPEPRGMHTAAIKGSDPYALAAGIDRFVSAAQGKTSADVVIASGDHPAYAMPAAGWAAESGDPVLFVNGSGVPAADPPGAARPSEARTSTCSARRA